MRECAVQPFDAAAAIFDGALLGASETTYASGAMMFNSVITMAVLLQVQRIWPCMASVWISMKVMTLGRIFAGAWRMRSRASPFNALETPAQHA